MRKEKLADKLMHKNTAAGSIRAPATCNGLFSMRPSTKSTSMDGIVVNSPYVSRLPSFHSDLTCSLHKVTSMSWGCLVVACQICTFSPLPLWILRTARRHSPRRSSIPLTSSHTAIPRTRRWWMSLLGFSRIS